MCVFSLFSLKGQQLARDQNWDHILSIDFINNTNILFTYLLLFFNYLFCYYQLEDIIIIKVTIIIISIFKEDNVLSMTANLPYGPQMNTDTDYY